MSESNAVANNGTVDQTAETVTNRLKTRKAKSSRAERLDALWRRFEEHAFSLSGEVAGEKITLKADGFPDSLSPEGVKEHFRDNGAIGSRSRVVGGAKGKGKAVASGEVAAETAELLMEEAV